jgi:ABC-type uncharacterized transport system substrate-binding protein
MKRQKIVLLAKTLLAKTWLASAWFVTGGLALTALVQPAVAHPHVFVAAKAEVIFDGAGSIIGVNHVWTFDESYSAFATMGFPKGADGKFDAAKLAELAKVNTESLADFGFFTAAKAGGRKVDFSPPQNYRLEHHNNALTLFLTLPLKRPVAGRTFSIEVSDPTFFVAFSFDEAADAVVLARAPEGCKATVRRPKPDDLSSYSKLSDQIFSSLSGKSEVSDAFANRAIIACP